MCKQWVIVNVRENCCCIQSASRKVSARRERSDSAHARDSWKFRPRRRNERGGNSRANDRVDAMNALTQIRNTQKATMLEVEAGMGEDASWHARFKHSAYIYAGGLPFNMTEGDILTVFSQYGEIVDVNLVREEETGKSRGFAFVCYADQRSTVLAVDNLNGATVVGRTIRVDHVDDYKMKGEDEAGRREWRCVCGSENFKFRESCFKCGTPRPTPKKEEPADDDEPTKELPQQEIRDGRDIVDAAGPRSADAEDEDAKIIRELQARKAAAIARAEAAAKGLPLDDAEDERDRKRHKKEKKEKKEKRDRDRHSRRDSRERR